MAAARQVEDNLSKQAAVMQVIEREQAAYKQAFGYAEWRAACEVGRDRSHHLGTPLVQLLGNGHGSLARLVCSCSIR